MNIFKYMYFFLCVSENWSSEPWYSMEDLFCLFSFQIIEAVNLSNDERESWRCAFYHGPAFPTMSKILLGSKCTHQTYHCMLLLSMLPPVILKHFWHSNPFRHFGLSDVAVKWLQKVHASARNEIYDSFFVKGPPTEVIQALVPALSEKEDSKEDHRAFCLNLERWYS